MGDETNTRAATGGIGFLGALTIAFIVLKLCHVIDWSWWWVLAPIWIPIVVILALMVIALLAILIGYLAKRLA